MFSSHSIHGSRRRTICVPSVLALLLIGLFACDTAAQLRPGPGSRVRMSVPGHDLLNALGTVQQVENDLFVVQLDGRSGVSSFHSDEIVGLAVLTGSRRQTLKGGAVGLFVGAMGGTLLGLAQGDDPPCGGGAWNFCFRMTAEDYAAVGAIGFGLLGGVAGLIAGSLTKADVWTSAELGGRGGFVRPGRSGGSLDVGFRLR